MFVEDIGGGIHVVGVGGFLIRKSFDCGQCFRFDLSGGADFVEAWGVALGRYIGFRQNESGDELFVYNCSAEEFLGIWVDYLSLDVDYSEVLRVIENAAGADVDPRGVLKLAAEFGRGIRIFRQDPWEALCSFIISQNNNIPRIKKIIARLCERYGDKIFYGDSGVAYSFPSPERLVQKGADELRELKVGFRAPYIIDAAEKVISGEVDFNAVKGAGSLQAAIDELCKIRGVGLKVASCAALFGFGRSDAFPIDVWMKRSIERHFPHGLDPLSFGEYAGIAQQLLFYYERYNERYR